MVEATLRERRKRVTKRSREGNVDSSSDSLDDSVTIRTAIANDILQAKSMSNSGVGKRIRSVARIVTSAIAKIILLRNEVEVFSGPDELVLLETAITIVSPEQNWP